MPYGLVRRDISDDRSNGDSPPVADEARLDHVQEEHHQIGPEAKPDDTSECRQSSRQRSKPGDPEHVSGQLESWEREDHWVDKHVTSTPAGPDWKRVTRRRVYDMDTDELIEDVEVVTGADEAAYLYPIASIDRSRLTTNIRTVLSYRAANQM